MSKISQEIVTIKFSKLVSDGDPGTYVDSSSIKAAIQSNISTLFSFNTITEVEVVANLLIEGNSFPVTNVSGTGSIATLSFPTQGSAPFVSGQSITVQNVTPSGYNGTYAVLTCGTSNVTVACIQTGTTSFVANVGTITEVS